MIAQFYRFIVVNNSGQLLTYNSNGRINLKVTGWLIDPETGKIAYTQLVDDDLGFEAGSSLADAAEIIGDVEITNVTTGYLGLHAQLEITHDEGTAVDPSGTFDVFVSEGDATGELVTDTTGYGDAVTDNLPSIGNLKWPGEALDDEVIRSSNMHYGG